MASTGTEQALAGAVPQPDAAAPTPRERWVDLGLVLFIGFAPLLVSSIYELFFPTVASAVPTNLRFSVGLIQQTGVLALCLILLRRQGRSFKNIGLSLQWWDVPKGIGLFILSYITFLVVEIGIQFSHFLWTGSIVQLRDPKTIFPGASLMLLLMYMVAAPLFEEILIRGYLMTELIGLSCPVWLAATASVVLQGGYHLYYGLATAFMLSAGFAVLATYFAISRRLLPVILAHFLWDLTASYLNWHR